MTGGEREFASWARPDDDAPTRRRRDRDGWDAGVLFAVIGLVLFDGLALVVTTVALVRGRLFQGIPCANFWSDYAGYALDGVWFVAALVVVTVGLAWWRRFHPVTVTVTQLLVAAVLLPTMLTTWSDASAVASGHKLAAQVDTRGTGCNPN